MVWGVCECMGVLCMECMVHGVYECMHGMLQVPIYKYLNESSPHKCVPTSTAVLLLCVISSRRSATDGSCISPQWNEMFWHAGLFRARGAREGARGRERGVGEGGGVERRWRGRRG
jgi:hypothetical protein